MPSEIIMPSEITQPLPPGWMATTPLPPGLYPPGGWGATTVPSLPENTMDPCMFLSTEPLDPISALIRMRTQCDWSHFGFYDRVSGLTFSAMLEGGVKWRPVGTHQKMMLLTTPHIQEIFNEALKYDGIPYDQLDIVGIALGLNLHTSGHVICDVLGFKAAQESGFPLLNMAYIPLWHLTPRDILLADVKQFGDIFTGPQVK